ncbi:CoA transferase subunit A [Chloroflexota bacterium]
MINKEYSSFETAVADIPDGAVIMMGNFAGPGGFPLNLCRALRDKAAKNLTIIANTAGGTGLTLDFDDHRILFESKQVKKVIAAFPFSVSSAYPSPCERQILVGEVELEIVPQGTLAERIRAGGYGIGAFYTPTGVGTVVERGKEKKVIDGKEMLLEFALRADYALIRGYKADRLGNLIYRGTARQFNPLMATAARVTIVEVDEIVKVGELEPEVIVTPGIFVQRIVKVTEDNGFPRHLEQSFQVRKDKEG